MKNVIEKKISLMSKEEMERVLLTISNICQRKDEETSEITYYQGLCQGSNIQKSIILDLIVKEY